MAGSTFASLKISPALRQLARMALAAGVYLATAQICHALRQSNPSLSAIWAPAGLALVFTLVWGRSMALGIWAGAFIHQLLILDISPAFQLAGFLAFGEALQAWASAWLLRWALKSLPPHHAPEALLATGLLAFTSLISPLARMSVFLAIGQTLRIQDIFPGMQTGWLAQFLALILIPPFALVLLHKKNREEKALQPYLWALTSLMIGLVLYVFSIMESQRIANLRLALQDDTRQVSSTLERTIVQREFQSLVGLRAFFDASEEVTQSEFALFTQSYLVDLSDSHTFAWAPRVREHERLAFEQNMRSQGCTDFFVFEFDQNGSKIPAAGRQDYFPVIYIQPNDEARCDFIGCDQSARIESLEAMQRAGDNGLPAITAPLRLEHGAGRQSVLMILPVYDNPSSVENVQSRRDQLSGFVVGWFSAPDVLTRVMERLQMRNVDVALQDISDPHEAQFLAFFDGKLRRVSPQENDGFLEADADLYFETIAVGGRTWQVILRPTAGYLAGTAWWVAWVILAGGLSLSGFFLFYLHSRQQSEAALQQSQEDLQTAQAIARLGSWKMEPRSGTSMSWSQEMFRLFQRDPARGVPDLEEFLDLVHPDDRRLLLDTQEKAIASGERAEVEYRTNPAYQSTAIFKASLQPVYDDTGRLVHLAGAVLDVTESRQMEENIRERVKELTCLFEVSRLLENSQASIDAVCQKIVESITPAMRYPHLAAAELELDGVRYLDGVETAGERRWLESEIIVQGERRGVLKVFYSQPLSVEISEQQEMLGNIAHMLGMWLEQRAAENAVRAVQQQLEVLNRALEQRVQERTADLYRSEATYRALFEKSSDAIFLFSPDGMDVTPNQKALEMLGYSLEEYRTLISQDMNLIATPEERLEANARFQAALRGEILPLYERTWVTKSGQRIQVEINLSAIRDESGKVIFVQSMARDITERKKVEENLRESYERLSAANLALEEAARLKDEFLASMSHELRTPLAGIIGLAQVMQLPSYGELTEKQFKAVKNIEGSGQHLLTLINDLLDLSKIEAGKMVMDFQFCSVAEICRQSLRLVKGMPEGEKRQISYYIEPEQIFLYADPRRLKQMLVNLLSNAIKFSPEGSEIGLEASIQESEGWVCFKVWDHGIGIAKEQMDKLFKPFSQIDSKLSRRYSGAGLGLSLVKRMVDLHGGSVQVESEPDKGSIFSIFLPWQKQWCEGAPGETFAENEAAWEALPVGDDYLKAGRNGEQELPMIMMADDNEVILDVVGDYLKARGYYFVAVRSGLELLEYVAGFRPDLVLMDIQMPGMDGIETIQRLRASADEGIASTPVIAVTALAMSGDREAILAAGADEYISKPLALDQLVRLIRQILAHKRN